MSKKGGIILYTPEGTKVNPKVHQSQSKRPSPKVKDPATDENHKPKSINTKPIETHHYTATHN